jgi:hypothetical protein
MKYVQDRYVLVFDRVDNHVLPNRQAAQARAEVITGAADARISSEQEKPLRNGIDDAISRGDIATFVDYIGSSAQGIGDGKSMVHGAVREIPVYPRALARRALGERGHGS